MKKVNYTKNIDVKYEVDVLVAGGGPSGVAAAIVAAREGAKVRIVEAGSCLGGLGTAGLVPAFMQFSDGVNFLAGGFGKELLDRCKKENGVYKNGSSIRVEELKFIYENMVAESGVEFTYHTKLIDVIKSGREVTLGICAAKSGVYAIAAKTFIDCTGDADLCHLAGAETSFGDEDGNTMPGTLCSLWSNVDWEVVRSPEGVHPDNKRIEEAFADGVFTNEDRHLPGMWHVSPTMGGGNIGHTFGVNGCDEVSLTEAYVWGRKSIREYERYYKEYMRGFENMELAATAPLLGIRETRRVHCDYMLTFKDFRPDSVFEDEIGRYSYPIDIHISNPDKESYHQYLDDFSKRLGKGESYGIPYRCLIPKDLDNVWVAGRCIGTDREMQASIRVMPGCYITGQAAGMAAALSLSTGGNSRKVEIPVLQSKLKSIGAFLPNS
jgi:ribulose 1,5-bisphosphate synthetase/thiazole synthase